MREAFPQGSTDFPRDRWHLRRYELTMIFLRRHVPAGSVIFDLGTPNAMSVIMAEHGYKVFNTMGEDLDLECFQLLDADCTSAFEILEHLVNPFELLRKLPSKRLVASVPLRLWFAKAYNASPQDRHFHEFEPWQFDWLLEKAGWKIMARELHTSPTYRLGLRSILRWIYPRWYFVYCERI
jgi:hypothetical protein